MIESRTKKLRGFACMSPEKRHEIAARGGAGVAAKDRSYSRNRDLARSAGRKGGISVSAENRTFSTNRELAREAGRKGGKATKKKDLNDETS